MGNIFNYITEIYLANSRMKIVKSVFKKYLVVSKTKQNFQKDVTELTDWKKL